MYNSFELFIADHMATEKYELGSNYKLIEQMNIVYVYCLRIEFINLRLILIILY